MWGPMEDLRPAAHRDNLSVDRALAALPDLLGVLNAFFEVAFGYYYRLYQSGGSVGGSVRSFHLGRASGSGIIIFSNSE